MSVIIRPDSWYRNLWPDDEREMQVFLRTLIGEGKEWRVPRRLYEELWRRRRPELNHVLGMRRHHIKLPRYQRGSVGVGPYGTIADQDEGGGGGGVVLTNITHEQSSVAPTPSRVHIRYHTNGFTQYYSGSLTSGFSYTTLTTQTDDSNDHTDEWWDTQPSTEEGLNYEIRYTSENNSGSVTTRWKFREDATTDTVVDTWVNLDTMYDYSVTDVRWGSWGVNRGNGTGKSPNTGSGVAEATIEIGEDGESSALDSAVVSLTVEGT